uniref:Uncharacterized protein n=1 Tax=Arundo donax TaxID=35708 RepID=A0A0A8YKN2_ARUDO
MASTSTFRFALYLYSSKCINGPRARYPRRYRRRHVPGLQAKAVVVLRAGARRVRPQLHRQRLLARRQSEQQDQRALRRRREPRLHVVRRRAPDRWRVAGVVPGASTGPLQAGRRAARSRSRSAWPRALRSRLLPPVPAS